MVVVGIDAHKRTHTAVAVDELGKKVATKTVSSTSAGNLELVRWAQGLGEHRFAVEDCRHISRRLERDLLGAGESLTRVPTKLMASMRRSARERGKSDPIDAMSVARAAQREDNLPTARLDGDERKVRLLCDHREDLVNERTRSQNRLHWHLHELDPSLELTAGSLDRYVVLDRLSALCATHAGTVAEIAAELVEKIRALTVRINELEREITSLVATMNPMLLELPGCGALSAAKIIGETAGVDRFSDRGRFARFNGTAPIPVWSSNTTRFRLNRGGNRQVNTALHRIAVTQLRAGPGKDYVERRMAMGNTKTEAIRALRRRISDEVYRRLVTDHAAREAGLQTCVPLAA
ncbi:MAG TPA: IS110 family transposase [Acidimicrobiales bacterium]|jgi:transposase|nr:IS110 family transposase [Acidimicrobiales bacterium]